MMNWGRMTERSTIDRLEKKMPHDLKQISVAEAVTGAGEGAKGRE